VSRNVEVLRQAVELGRRPLSCSFPEWRRIVLAAISALEEKEAQRVKAVRAECDAAWLKHYGPMLKSSSDSMEERIRALAEALEHMRWCRSCGEGPWEQCEEGRKAANLLHPHKSWCRGDHSEGACVSDPSERAE
jgi:hypothetical protein